jgi:hypothetical protein
VGLVAKEIAAVVLDVHQQVPAATSPGNMRRHPIAAVTSPRLKTYPPKGM